MTYYKEDHHTYGHNKYINTDSQIDGHQKDRYEKLDLMWSAVERGQWKSKITVSI